MRPKRTAQHGGRTHVAPGKSIPGLTPAANIVAMIDQTGVALRQQTELESRFVPEYRWLVEIPALDWPRLALAFAVQ